MTEIIYKPIGLIHSPYKDIQGMPIQSAGARDVQGTIEILPEFEPGLADLDGYSHIILLYHFHRTQGFSLSVKPFLDDNHHGVFATRAPRRPNPIGLSVVRLAKVEGTILHILDVDMVDGTPLLDIKPYVPEFDVCNVTRIGWLASHVKKVDQIKSDDRFK